MSIRPVDIYRQTSPDRVQSKSETTGGSKNKTGFPDLLDTAAERSVKEQGDLSDVTTKAEILRLRMMRMALSLHNENPTISDPVHGIIPEQLFRSMNAYQENSSSSIKQSGQTSESETNPEIISTNSMTLKNADRSIEEIILQASRRFGVDQGLIRAVIKAESNFNSRAVSPAGARGLMQLMPGTARGLGVTNSFDPEQNVMAGTRYLKAMLDRYNGDIDKALAAYNWGPGNVDKKGKTYPRETRAYLTKVKDLYSEYVG